MRPKIADAIRWWEPRRILYNAVLVAWVLARFYQGYPATRLALRFDNFLLLFGLAVLANVAYCAAYIPDLFLQLGGHQDIMPKARRGILAVGTGFAIVLTHFWSAALLGMNTQ